MLSAHAPRAAVRDVLAEHRVAGVSVWQLRKALMSYSHKKAAGPDAIEVQFLRALPDQILVFFVGFYRTVGHRGEWPSFVKAVYMALLPKPDGGVRTIGKTCMLYRMWARMRFPVTRAWENRAWLSGIKPKPTHRQVMRRMPAFWKLRQLCIVRSMWCAICGTFSSFLIA